MFDFTDVSAIFADFAAPAKGGDVMVLTIHDFEEIDESEAQVLEFIRDFDSTEAQLAALKGSW